MPARSSFSLPRFVLRGHQPRWLTPAAMASAVVFTVLLTAIPIRLAGANPPATFERYLVRPLSTQAGVFEVLLTATPLMFTGLAVAIAFRAGYWNIGAEGQFLAGAVCVTWVGTTFAGLPGPVAIPVGFEGQIRPRSGNALKYGLSMPNSPGTIDCDYRGEVKVLVVNLGQAPVTITRGMRIAQLIIAPVARASLQVVEALPDSARGEKGFGSTGKH